MVNPLRFKVLEIDEKRDYLKVECIGTNGYTHEEEWQGPGDGLTFTEHCIDIGEYEIINEDKRTKGTMTEVINVMILHLVLKKKWYEMQECGEKPEEYRDITPYWYQRLYQRKDEYGHAGPLTRDDAEYCCDPSLRYILKGKGFADTELRPYTHVCFHCGYTSQCFIDRIDNITIGRGLPEWGAPEDRDVFIIRHHREPMLSPDGWRLKEITLSNNKQL